MSLPLRASQRMNGVPATAGSGVIPPTTASQASPTARCASTWPARKSSPAGRQSSPRNRINSAAAAAIPALRAAAAPGRGSSTTLMDCAELSSAGAGLAPLFTTTTSDAKSLVDWDCSAASVPHRISQRSRVGITTLNSTGEPLHESPLRSTFRVAMAGEAYPYVVTVVLNWNGRDDTLACLKSLARLDWPSHETIVVDNGSTDGSVQAIEEEYPQVTIVANGRNLGFAAGNNVGLRAALAAGADYVLLLNNDTLVAPDALHHLVTEAERRPDAGALCPLIYYLDPPDRIWFAGARFDPRRGHNGRHTGYGETDRGQYDRVREIGRGTGAAMLVRRAAVEEVGLLDGDLYLQVEDVEWSLRLRSAGWRIFFVPAGKVWHRVSVKTGGEHSPATAYYELRNTLEVCDRYAPLRGVRAAGRRAAVMAVHVVHARRGRNPAENLRAVMEGWRDYRDGRLGARSTQPLIEQQPREDQAAPARAVRVA